MIFIIIINSHCFRFIHAVICTCFGTTRLQRFRKISKNRCLDGEDESASLLWRMQQRSHKFFQAIVSRSSKKTWRLNVQLFVFQIVLYWYYCLFEHYNYLLIVQHHIGVACYNIFGLDSINWNDRCSRRVFLCFYSVIFQLTSAKFQTFTYNSRTVGSSYMKFWQQFEINEFYVCTKFRGNRSRDFGFKNSKKRPASLA